MIIVRPVGGLANQMFPYAMGRAMALERETELLLDVRAFEYYRDHAEVSYRQFGLDVFQVKARILSSEESDHLVPAKPGRLERLRQQVFGTAGKAIHYRERSFDFDPGVFDVKGDVFFEGNWVSWKYFDKYADMIRADFQVKKKISGKNAEMSMRIKAGQSVSLHIRRGDYAHEARANAVHGLCSLDYYQAALDLIREKIARPEFFVFSDDIGWAKEHLQFSEPAHFVDWNGPLEAYEDLRLMSMCRHHVIANSGFSWWGAWLNPNPDKLVLAPRQWFATDKYDTRDLLPPEWIQL